MNDKKQSVPEELSSDIQKFIDILPFYAFLVDADHNILMANEALRQQFGFDKQVDKKPFAWEER